MAHVAAAAMAVSALVSVYSATRQFKAASEAEDLGRLNAAYTEAETREQARRMEHDQERTEARSTALAAASGLDIEFTMQDVLDEQKRLGMEELDWLRTSGRSRAKIAKEGGQIAADQATAAGWQSIGSAFGQASNIYGVGAKAKWWE